MYFAVSQSPVAVAINGGTLRNDGSVPIYYRVKTPVSSTVNDGSLTAGAAVTLDGTQYLTTDGPKTSVTVLPDDTRPFDRESPEALLCRGQGLVAQNFDRQVSQAATVMTGGTAYAMLVSLRDGDVIANINVECGTPATLPTLFKAGVYSGTAVTKFAETADQSGLFATSALKTLPLLAPWRAPTSGTYLIVVVATATTTLPTLWRGTISGNGTRIGANAPPLATLGTGLTDLPAAGASIASAGQTAWWVGLS
jgi:hypothetical protein